jgi:hypothetical protein
MPEQRDAVLQRFRDMRAGLLSAIESLTPVQLVEPTIDGWSVKDHLFHLAAWDTIRAQDVVRISAGHTTALRMTEEQDAAFSKLVYELSGDLAIEQAFWELSTSHERLIRAIEDATERGLDASLYGEAALLSTHEAQHTGWIRRWRGERSY